MIIQNDRKRLISQIMGDAPKEGGPEEGALHVLMTEFIDSVHAKEVSMAESAFKALYAHCNAGESEPEGE